MTKVIEVSDKIAHGKAIDEGIRRVIRTGEAFNQRVQSIAVMIVQHAMAHGDCLRAVKLCRAINPHQRNSLVGWFQVVSPINVIMGKSAADDNARFFKEDSPKRNPFNLDKAKMVMWWTDPLGVNPEPKPLEEHGAFWAGLEKYVTKAIADAKKEDAKAKYTEDARAAVLASADNVLKTLRNLRVAELAALAASNVAEQKQDNEQGQGEETTEATPSSVAHLPVGQAA